MSNHTHELDGWYTMVDGQDFEVFVDFTCTGPNEDGDHVIEEMRNSRGTLDGDIIYVDCPSCDDTDVELDR